MHLVAKVDELLITQVFEPISWHGEYYYRVGSARFSRILDSAALTIFPFQVMLDEHTFAALSLLLFILICDMTFGARFEKSRLYFQSFGFPNPMRPMWAFRLKWTALPASTYIVMLLLMPSWPFFAAVCCGIVFTAASLWFGACNPMPPSFRKEQEVKEVERHMQGSVT